MVKKSLKRLILDGIDNAKKLKDYNKQKFLLEIIRELKPKLYDYVPMSADEIEQENNVFLTYFKTFIKRKENNVIKYAQKKNKELLEIESVELATINYYMTLVEKKEN